MEIQPTETIEASRLVRVVDFGCFTDIALEVVLLNHLPELNREQRLFFVQKFPAIALEMIGPELTDEEVDLCCELHPSIALAQAPERISDR